MSTTTFTPLARGRGTWGGELELDLLVDLDKGGSPFLPQLDPDAPRPVTVPSPKAKTTNPPNTAPLLKRENTEISLPKTFITRKGALLLFTAPNNVELDPDQKNILRKGLIQARRAELETKFGTLARFAHSVLTYGDGEYPEESTSISDPNNRIYLGFSHDIEKTDDIDLHVKPGADPAFYLRELKTRTKSAHSSSGSVRHAVQATPSSEDSDPAHRLSADAGRLVQDYARSQSLPLTGKIYAQSPGVRVRSYSVLSSERLAASLRSQNYMGRRHSQPLSPELKALKHGSPRSRDSMARPNTPSSHPSPSPRTRPFSSGPSYMTGGVSLTSSHDTIGNSDEAKSSTDLSYRPASEIKQVWSLADVQVPPDLGLHDLDLDTTSQHAEHDPDEDDGAGSIASSLLQEQDINLSSDEEGEFGGGLGERHYGEMLTSATSPVQGQAGDAARPLQAPYANGLLMVKQGSSFSLAGSEAAGPAGEKDQERPQTDDDGAQSVISVEIRSTKSVASSHSGIPSERAMSMLSTTHNTPATTSKPEPTQDEGMPTPDQNGLVSDNLQDFPESSSNAHIVDTPQDANIEEIPDTASNKILVESSADTLPATPAADHLVSPIHPADSGPFPTPVPESESATLTDPSADEGAIVASDSPAVDLLGVRPPTKHKDKSGIQSHDTGGGAEKSSKVKDSKKAPTTTSHPKENEGGDSKSLVADTTEELQRIFGGVIPKSSTTATPPPAKKDQKNKKKLVKTDSRSSIVSQQAQKETQKVSFKEEEETEEAKVPEVESKIAEIPHATENVKPQKSLRFEDEEIEQNLLKEKPGVSEDIAVVDTNKAKGKKVREKRVKESKPKEKNDQKSKLSEEREKLRAQKQLEKKKRLEEALQLQQQIREKEDEKAKQEEEAVKKKKNLEDELAEMAREAENIKLAEEEAKAAMAASRKAAREEREARRRAELEKKKAEAQQKREGEKKLQEEARKRERDMLERIADAEERRKMAEEERLRKEEDEWKMEQQRLMDEEQMTQMAIDEEEKIAELERQAEEEALQRLMEEREEALERQKRLMKEAEDMEQEQERQRLQLIEEELQLQKERKQREDEELRRKEEEKRRLLEIERQEEELRQKMKDELRKRREAALLRREHNVEHRNHLHGLKQKQGLTKPFVFSYYVAWPRETYERLMGANDDKKRKSAAGKRKGTGKK